MKGHYIIGIEQSLLVCWNDNMEQIKNKSGVSVGCNLFSGVQSNICAENVRKG